MATFNPRRFSKPDTLRKISRNHLIDFLKPYETYLAGRGLMLSTDPALELDYERLSHVLLNADTTTPPELVEALYYVDELSTPHGFDSILDAISESDLDTCITSDVTAADLAIQLWMHDRDLAEHVHAEQYLHRPRSFVYFVTTGDIQDCQELDESGLHMLESDLDNWFEKKRRGRTTKVFVYRKPDFTWFLIRHGEPFTREPSLNSNNEEESEYFRPMKFDLIAYNPYTGEIRINARSKGQQELYRTQIGKHFFSDPDYFDAPATFRLDPLCELGEDSLVCSDIDGMEHAKLKEIQIYHGGPHKETEIRKADDLFAIQKEHGRNLSGTRGIIKASFSIKFADSKIPRTLTISGNRAEYKRDEDATVLEKWLTARGFAILREAS